MTNRDGGAEADITVSVLENGDGSSVLKPKFEGEKGNKFKHWSVGILVQLFCDVLVFSMVPKFEKNK